MSVCACGCRPCPQVPDFAVSGSCPRGDAISTSQWGQPARHVRGPATRSGPGPTKPGAPGLTFSLGFGSVSMLSSAPSDPSLDALRSFPGIIQQQKLGPTGFLNRVQRRESNGENGPPPRPGLCVTSAAAAHPAEAACTSTAVAVAAARGALDGTGVCGAEVLCVFEPPALWEPAGLG